MRKITGVLIDRAVLDGFKRRALKHYPREYAEQLWGTVGRSRAHICVIEPVDLTQQSRDSVDFDFDQQCGSEHSGLILLGSIHTHPAPWDHTSPSDSDIRSALHDKEIIWGICGIRKAKTRHFTSFRFLSNSHGEVELTIGENNDIRARAASRRSQSRIRLRG